VKSRTLMCTTAITLFAALATPLQLAAQEKDDKPKHHHYKLIDMGTFGGPASSINYPVFGGNLNRQGITVGWSATATPTLPTSNPLICGGLDGVVPYITHAFEWNGGVANLGALAPDDSNCSEPFAINAKGDIVGASEGDEIDPVFGVKGAHAVLWKDGKITDLGSLGGNEVAAFGINNRGQIIGNSTNAIPDPYCFFGTVQNRAFLWEHGLMQDLGTLGGNCAGVGGLNEHGQITGGSTTTTVANPVTGFPTQEPFLWEKGRGMRDLGTLGGAFGGAGGVNNQGQVIGQSSIAADPGACNGFPDNGDNNCHPFLWEDGNLIDLNTTSIGGNPEFVAGLNDAGEIVGWAAFPNAPMDAFLWRKGVVKDLGRLDGCISGAHAINLRTQIVGFAASCVANEVHAFLWENGSIVDLNALIPLGSSLQLADAMDINERGEIDGIGVPPGVESGNLITEGHGFLLIPCDENHLNIDGCDYSLVEVGAPVIAASPMPSANMPTTASPSLSPDAIRQLLRSVGPGSTPWTPQSRTPAAKAIPTLVQKRDDQSSGARMRRQP